MKKYINLKLPISVDFNVKEYKKQVIMISDQINDFGVGHGKLLGDALVNSMKPFIDLQKVTNSFIEIRDKLRNLQNK